MGSDWSVSTANPLLEMETAVTRISDLEREEPPFLPEERIDLVDALAAFTAGAAWVNHLEHEIGSLEVGKTADLVILDRDLFDRAAGPIGEARVVGTFIDGVPGLRGRRPRRLTDRDGRAIQRRSAGDIDVAQGRAVGIEPPPGRLVDDRWIERLDEGAESAFTGGYQCLGRLPGWCGSERGRQRPVPALAFEHRRTDRRLVEMRDQRLKHRRQHGRHVAGDDDGHRLRGRTEAGHQSDERPFERGRVVDHEDAAGHGRRIVGPCHHDRLRGKRADGGDGVIQQGSAGERLGELVAPEAAGTAAGEDDRADPGQAHRPISAALAARGPGTWPASVRRRIPRRSRSSRIAIT